MCHERYHVDPDLRSIANSYVGLTIAITPEQRALCQDAASLLLNTVCCDGFIEYLQTQSGHLDPDFALRLHVKLRSIRARLGEEAYQLSQRRLAIDDIPY